MNIETTTCISYEHLEVLQSYATHRSQSLHSFIVGLINFVISYKKIPVKGYKRVSYRPRLISKWKRVHLYLYDNEYEFLMDVKKIMKMSLAKVIAYCIDNFLFDFIAALDKEENTDNYRCSGYTFGFFLDNGIPCCHFYWGPHPEIIKQTQQPSTI